ncbi:MAG TPA: cupin domain-containing protein [Clostridia bacterium]|nr:cupin domain-containing protein [Clostridia bacterium]
MVRKGSERNIETAEHRFGGEGFVTVRHLINTPEELNGKGRTFAHTTLLPGHSIGFHIHEGESETYYIYSGKGEFNDNGVIKTVEAGDVTFTPPGTSHGIKNIGDTPLEMIALILYA